MNDPKNGSGQPTGYFVSGHSLSPKFQVGNVINIAGQHFVIRKITARDVLLRPVAPPPTKPPAFT